VGEERHRTGVDALLVPGEYTARRRHRRGALSDEGRLREEVRRRRGTAVKARFMLKPEADNFKKAAASVAVG